jgi:hypothetical protein
MSAYGIGQEEIATVIGLRSVKTLRRHFRQELDRGAIGANAQVAQTLYKMATSGNSPAATIFWLKARAGWRDGQEFDQRPQAAPPFLVAPERKTA